MTTIIQPIGNTQYPNFYSKQNWNKTNKQTKQKKKNTSESGVSFQDLLEQELQKVDLLA
jgi:flagellar hook-basal body complex protein FliE